MVSIPMPVVFSLALLISVASAAGHVGQGTRGNPSFGNHMHRPMTSLMPHLLQPTFEPTYNLSQSTMTQTCQVRACCVATACAGCLLLALVTAARTDGLATAHQLG